MPEQIKTKTIKPFKYKPHALDLNISSFKVDSDEGDERRIFPERYLVELEHYNDYETFSLELEISYSYRSLEDLVPKNEREDDVPIEFVVVARCPQTSVRKAIYRGDVEKTEEEGKIAVEQKLELKNYRGKIMIKPYVVRTDTRDRDDPLFASLKGSKLATGKEWEVRLDLADDVGFKGLEPEWEDFSKDDLPAHEDMLYHLDTGVKPTLYLNDSSSEVKAVFHSEGTRGKDARMRDVFFNAIVIPVHIELVFDALEGLDRETLEFEHDWQKGILMSLIDDMLKDKDISGEDAKLEEITDIYNGEQGSKLIASRVQRAVQIETDPVGVMESLVEEVREV
jgi:hypothetical protein